MKESKRAYIPVTYDVVHTLLGLPEDSEVVGFGIEPAMQCLLVYVAGEGLPDKFLTEKGTMSPVWPDYMIQYVDPKAQYEQPVETPIRWEGMA